MPGSPVDPAHDPYRRRPWLSSYPPGVPHTVDVPAVPLSRLLDDAVKRREDHVALAFLGRQLTYGELRRHVDAVAGALAGLGVGRGDRVALVLPTCPQFVVACFAALRLGAVVVPHNPLSAAPELARRLAESGATVAVCLDRAYPVLAAARDRTALRHVLVTSLADYLPRRARLALRLPLARARRRRDELATGVPPVERVRRFPDLLRRSGTVPQADLDPELDVAVLAWTGGTTAPARAAVLTHAALVANAAQVRAWLPEAGEVVLGALPLWHPYGFTLGLTSTVLRGGTLVLLPDGDVRALLAAVDEHRPTVLPGVPALLRSVVEAPDVDQHDLTSLRVGISVGMPLPEAVRERFERLTGGRLLEAYGLAEATALTHAEPPGGPRRPGTIGLPLPGTRARLLDPDDHARTVPVGAPGELAVTGPQLSSGYWRRPQDTRTAVTGDGHHLTGDLAVMDADGVFTLLDRVADVLRVGGRLVPPGRVEAVLAGLPGVADAAVVAAPAGRRDAGLVAYVVPEPGVELDVDTVRRDCAALLPPEEVPATVEVRPQLPRTVVGAVLRRRLREELPAGPPERGPAEGPASPQRAAAARPSGVTSAGTGTRSSPRARPASRPSPRRTPTPPEPPARRPPAPPTPAAAGPEPDVAAPRSPRSRPTPRGGAAPAARTAPPEPPAAPRRRESAREPQPPARTPARRAGPRGGRSRGTGQDGSPPSGG